MYGFELISGVVFMIELQDYFFHVAPFFGSRFEKGSSVLFLSSLHPVPIDMEGTGVDQTPDKPVVIGSGANVF